MPPRPGPPMIISVTMAMMSEMGSAICSPVMIVGKAAGKMISRRSWRSLAPSMRADHSVKRSTPCAAAIVAVTTGNIASKMMSAIFEVS